MPGTGTEEYYQRRAGEYDRVYAKPERQADLATLPAEVAGLLAGRRVLEVAAGTGWWTDVLAASAAGVVATDVNRSTLEVAPEAPVAGDGPLRRGRRLRPRRRRRGL